MIKDSRELRAFLLEQLVKVVNGEVSPVVAKGAANMAQQIYNTLNIEIKMAKAHAELGDAHPIQPVPFNDG